MGGGPSYMNQFAGQFAGDGGGGGSAKALIDRTFSLGGDWYNTGYGFTSSNNIGLGYDGSYTSLIQH
ncbi:hypothetical protein [Chryseobacterium sp. CT-SW4]|uniref:hypothetical protein n=1 Tax=Chryseobacterium sp. SW-1 TaxID=3157343 RepID=UPI003B017F85